LSYPEIRSGFDGLLQRGLKRLRADAQPVMVASHERSGTHFTMNTLAACLGYASRPWVNIDQSTFNINYFHRGMMTSLLQTFADLRTASLAKSHHEFAFFSEVVGELRNLQIIYVYRHPADVMVSFWRFLHSWPWTEGPKTDGLLEFVNTPPMGRLMRYQHRQHADMLDRWADHVEGWVDAAAQLEHVHLVRYEDLAHDFDGAVAKLAEALKIEPLRVVRPSPHDNVVTPGPAPFTGTEASDDREMVTLLAFQRYPDLMRRLGYERPSKAG
jgi:hypothetical protein